MFPGEHLLHILLYGSNVYNPVSNELIITETIILIFETLDGSLIWKHSDRLIYSSPPPIMHIILLFIDVY